MEIHGKVREFLVNHTDDYRSGPRLEYIELFDSNINDEFDENFFEADFELPDNRYHVFHLSIDFSCGNTYLLKSFDDKLEAVNYAKKQYVLYTGNDPFIADGRMTSAYHPEGNCPAINVDGMTSDITNDDGDNYEYLVIINEKDFEAHSLNSFAIW